MDSTGSYEYSEVEREFIYNYIGDMQLYKKLLPLMNDKELNKQVGLLRAHRVQGGDLDNEEIKIKTQNLPIFQKIDKIVRDAQIEAENVFLEQRRDIKNTIEVQQAVDHATKQGDIQKAADLQKEELKTRKTLNLLQMAK